jgi:hypothetical protein
MREMSVVIRPRTALIAGLSTAIAAGAATLGVVVVSAPPAQVAADPDHVPDVHGDIFDTGMLGPQAGYEVDVQQADVSGNGTTVLGAQPVTGLDGQATAIYTASPGTHSQGITLVAWSGDAVMQFTYEPVAPALGGPPPSRSAELAIVTGIARAVFAALPHSAAS